jgi:flap endonuclease-1
MGIQNLKRLIADNVPSSIKEGALTNYFGRRIAIDASMFLYSFLVAIRSDSQFLVDASGETTSHLQGIFNRTVRLLECGIKPVYVFDGKPPTLKSGELAKRSDRKRIASEALKVAEEQGLWCKSHEHSWMDGWMGGWVVD